MTTRNGPYLSNYGHLFYTELLNGKQRSIWAHREIMEAHLGRKLLRSEIVHHLNENKLDNRIENLVLTNAKEHAKIHNTPAELVTFVCPVCGQTATKLARHVRGNKTKGKAGPYCGRVCAGKTTGNMNRKKVKAS